MPFQVGDLVRISRASEYYSRTIPNNPRDIDGRIRNLRDGGGHHIEVSWDNGHTNVYRHYDLELATPATPATVETQKAFAISLLEKLRLSDYNVVVSGGAVLDWSEDVVANDIDIYLNLPEYMEEGQMLEHLGRLLDVDVRFCSEGYTGDSSRIRTVFELHEQETRTKAQLIILNNCCPREAMESFPYTHTRMYWDGDSTTVSESCINSLGIVEKLGDCSQAYTDKVLKRIKDKGWKLSNSSSETADLMLAAISEDDLLAVNF